MYSVFLNIFEKHVPLLNFKIKCSKVRNYLQVNVITQSIPSLIKTIGFFSQVKVFLLRFLREILVHIKTIT